MGTHLRELSESFPMNTNMTGFRCFSNIFASLCLDERSLSIGRVKNDLSYFLYVTETKTLSQIFHKTFCALQYYEILTFMSHSKVDTKNEGKVFVYLM